VLTGKMTGAAAPCMVSWMVPAAGNCCLCCAEVSLKDRCTSALCCPLRTFFFFPFFCWLTGELSTLRQMMKVPNEPGLCPNNGLENAFLSNQSMASNPRKGQAKRFGAKTTSHDGKAGHVMTHVCHRARQEQRQVRPCKRRCRKHAPLHLAQRLDRQNCRAKQCQVSTSS